MQSALRHAGWKFPYRHPPPDGLIEKTLSGLGKVFRAVGVAMDNLGASLQGAAALRETGACFRDGLHDACRFWACLAIPLSYTVTMQCNPTWLGLPRRRRRRALSRGSWWMCPQSQAGPR